MTNKGIIAGIVAASTCAVVLAGLIFVLTRPPSVNSINKKAKKKQEKSPIDKTVLIKIYDDITKMMQIVVMNLAEHEQQMRAKA